MPEKMNQTIWWDEFTPIDNAIVRNIQFDGNETVGEWTAYNGRTWFVVKLEETENEWDI